MIRAAADARATLEALVGEPLEAAELSHVVGAALDGVLHHDGWCLFAVDPTSGLRIAQFGGRGTDYTSDLARNEAVMSDVNRYADLARAPVPVGWLSREHSGATGSFRYNRTIRPSGFGSELRAVLRDGDRVWGGLTLFRESSSRPYGDEHVPVAASLLTPLARALRTFAARDIPHRGEPPPAGVIAMSRSGGVATISPGAQQWLEDLVPGGPDDLTTSENMTRVAHDAAYAVRRGDAERAATCLRTVRGHWLRVAAVPMVVGGADVAVTFQTASATQIARAMAEVCGLTARERQVLGLLIQGEPAKLIARKLDVSVLTVNGHLRSIYRKCHVRGRDELFARLV